MSGLKNDSKGIKKDKKSKEKKKKKDKKKESKRKERGRRESVSEESDLMGAEEEVAPISILQNKVKKDSEIIQVQDEK